MSAKNFNIKAAINEEKRTALHNAAGAGQKDLVELALQKGSDVDAADGSGWRPLHLACMSGPDVPAATKCAIVDLLISKGAKMDAETRSKETPLHRAAGEGLADVVQTMLKRGALVNAKTEQGFTPLHHACRCDQLETVKVLLQAKADPTVKDKNGQTPFSMAGEKTRTWLKESGLLKK